jgi:RHS repeat-associated protein
MNLKTFFLGALAIVSLLSNTHAQPSDCGSCSGSSSCGSAEARITARASNGLWSGDSAPPEVLTSGFTLTAGGVSVSDSTAVFADSAIVELNSEGAYPDARLILKEGEEYSGHWDLDFSDCFSCWWYGSIHCDKPIEVSMDDGDSWNVSSEVGTNKYYDYFPNDFLFRLQKVKSVRRSPTETDTSEPSIPDDDADVPPDEGDPDGGGSGGQPPTVTPAGFYSKVDLGEGLLVLEGALLPSLADVSNLKYTLEGKSAHSKGQLFVLRAEGHIVQVRTSECLATVAPLLVGAPGNANTNGFEVKIFELGDVVTGAPNQPSVIPPNAIPSSVIKYIPIPEIVGGHLGGIRYIESTFSKDNPSAKKFISREYVNPSGGGWQETIGNQTKTLVSFFTYNDQPGEENDRWERTDLLTVKRGGVEISSTESIYTYQYRKAGTPPSIVARNLFLRSVTRRNADGSIIGGNIYEPDPLVLGRIVSTTSFDDSWEIKRYYSLTDTVDPTWVGRVKQTLKPLNNKESPPFDPSELNCESTIFEYATSSSGKVEVSRRTTTRPVGGAAVVVSDWKKASPPEVEAGLNASLSAVVADAGVSSYWNPVPSAIISNSSEIVVSGTERIRSTLFSYSNSPNYYDVATYQLNHNRSEVTWGGKSFGSLDAEGNGYITVYELGSYSDGVFTTPTPIGSDVRETTLKVANYSFPAYGERTREIVIRNRLGHPYLREMSVHDASSWQVATTTTYEYPELFGDGKPKDTIVRQDGRVISRELIVSGTETQEWDEQGIQTITITDELDRTVSITRKGVAASSGTSAQPDIVTTYAYNGLTTTRTTTAGSLTRTEVSVVDGQGRTVSETDATGAVTLTSYPDNGLETLTTYPGGATRLVTRDTIGRTVSVTGTAVVGQYYQYETLADGSLKTTVRSGDSPTSPRYTATITDPAGRKIQTITPSPTGVGEATTTYTYAPGTKRLASRTVPGESPQLFTKPATDSQTQLTGYDVDADSVLSPVRTDRVIESKMHYAFEGGYWWEVSTRQQHSSDYPVSVPGGPQYSVLSTAITTITKRCLHGQPDGFATKTVTIAPSGLTTTTTTAIDRATKTRTITKTTNACVTSAVTVNVNGLDVSQTTHDSTVPTLWSHSSFGQPIKETSPRGAITQRSYYPDGKLWTVTDHAGKTTRYDYYGPTHISHGKVSVMTNPQGKTTTYAYSPRGETTEMAGAAAYKVTYEYNIYGAMSKMYTWRDATTSDLTQWFYWPSTGHLLGKRDAASQTVTYTYNASGKLVTRKWQRPGNTVGTNNTTTYGYTTYGDLESIDYSDSTPDVTFSDFGRLGRPFTITQAGIGSETIIYNGFTGEIANRYYSSSHTLLPGLGISYRELDIAGRPAGVNQTSGSDTTVTRSVGYAYDPQGRLKTVTAGTQSQIYGYYTDPSVAAPQSHIYAYHGNSSLIDTITSRQGTSDVFRQSRSYDAQARLISIRSARAGSSTAAISSYSYDYDELNRRTKTTQQDGSAWEYGYNDRSEVTAATRKTSTGTTIPQLGASYSYDGIGNRLTSTSPVLGDRTYTPNSRNQYASITTGNSRTAIGRAPATWSILVNNTAAQRTGDLYHSVLTAANSSTPVWNEVITKRDTGTPTSTGHLWHAQTTTVPTYDSDGNLKNDGRWIYSWDAENRLIFMRTTPEATAAGHPYTKLQFVYNWEGKRIARHVWQGGTDEAPTFLSSTRYLYDAWNVIAEYTSSSLNSENLTLKTSLTWGTDLSGTPQGAGGVGGLLLITDHSAPVTSYLPSYDGNGNITAWTASNGTSPISRKEYDAFGNTLVSEGVAPCSYGFSTKPQDKETGLYYYGYRYYDPNTGRWLNRDPIQERGGMNLYGFVSNHGVALVDVLGLKTISDTANEPDPNPGSQDPNTGAFVPNGQVGENANDTNPTGSSGSGTIKMDYNDTDCNGSATVTLTFNANGNWLTQGHIGAPNQPGFSPIEGSHTSNLLPGQQGPPTPPQPNPVGPYIGPPFNPGGSGPGGSRSTSITVSLSSCNSSCCNVTLSGTLILSTQGGAHALHGEYTLDLKGSTNDCKIKTDASTVKAFFK